jgi:hypothetical protein
MHKTLYVKHYGNELIKMKQDNLFNYSLKKYAVSLVCLGIEANDVSCNRNESSVSMITSNSCEMLRNDPVKYTWDISHADFSIK